MKSEFEELDEINDWNKKSSTQFISISLPTAGFLLTIVFLILKITNVWPELDWFWVWFPLWIPFVAVFAIFFIVTIIVLIINAIRR